VTDSSTPPEPLTQKFTDAGQGHVFKWWNELSEDGKANLIAQLETIDLTQLADLCDKVERDCLTPIPQGAPLMPEYIGLPNTPQEEADRAKAKAVGEELLRAGKVAALTVAGGQGTRLGFDAPKGTFPIGTISSNSLFELHADRIAATQRRYDSVVPWCIMTSEINNAATREYFEENNYFGLNKADVTFFTQKMMPVVDREYKLVLNAKDNLLMSPNGHGGTMLALHDCGILDDMAKRGVEEISYFQIDNAIVPAIDPVFIGYHHMQSAQMSSKTIWKRDPAEGLGAFVRMDGRLIVIEYSDLTDEQMHETTADGRLTYGLGSPAIHVINADFARDMTAEGFKLPFHLAEKNADILDANGELQEVTGKNVLKFETFIFDALADTERSVILEIRREDEFSPVKNADGADSPESCRRDMTAQYARWLEAAGVTVPRNENGEPIHHIEISPLYALDAEELAEKICADIKIDAPLYLAPDSECK